ncbi:uncharacterized protein LOC656542 [Tribolium castaneum]|uniref:Mitochondria-eating protein n=1 Tax=Tribolium castaneum TaxID=7070 RepID=D6X0V5_TRICA|nr:PREDICTED: uncharacterized protein LOC656542 [Tribolium castaneum]EFA09543.2 hypothetical protein TcasGA2_TC011651 [Tribolium castaneum]|eukprot:XP_008198452.1 PREDICTED: uncharacterized protein LOC656542 [Tribolium castaneum]
MRDSGDRIRRERTSPTSSRTVLRRVLVLSEGRQFREAAAVLQKLNCNSVAAVAADLPLDFLAEGLPHSAQLLETLFNKLITSGQRPNVNAEQVLWQLVKLFASHEDPTLKTKVARLTQILVDYQPEFYRILATKKKALEHAIQGLGCHGLTPDASGLTHLHVAIKAELHRHIDAYKNALHRLDELGLAAANSKKPVDASHQRLLALHHSEVQQRLIDNKTLLTILDKPDLKQLRPLVDTLATRVQNDKEALFCVSQLKRLHPSCEEKPVAALLMAFARGCGALLELMQTPESPCSSDGYHSESEQDNDRGKDLIGRYASLYYQHRPRALEALDSLPELAHATQLKSKILFSVVVLAFRTCKNLRDTKLKETFRNLHLDCRTAAGQHLRDDVVRCLAACAETYPLGEAEHQVRALVCDTLKEYKCLETCTALRRYVGDVTRVAWLLVNQVPGYELDTDFQTPVRLKNDRHQRHHSADRTSDVVKAYLWPALVVQNVCVYKAVVVTGGT